jgi:hypothetical protein
MNTNRDPDVTITAWLEDGPLSLPPATRQIVEASIHVTPQRRKPLVRLPWRFPDMNTPFRVAAAAVIGVLLLGGAYYLFGGGGGPGIGGPPPTPGLTSPPEASDRPTPTPIDTSSWVPFVSDRYGYEIAYPSTSNGNMDLALYCGPGCTPTSAPTSVQPADGEWSLDADAGDKLTRNWDRFFLGPDGYQIMVSAFSQPIAEGTTQDAWHAAAIDIPPCVTPKQQEAVTVDGHPGRLYVGCDSSVAIIVVGERAYVFAEWRGEFTELLKAFLTTVRITGPDASPSSAAP